MKGKEIKNVNKKERGKEKQNHNPKKDDQFYYFVEFDSLQDVDLLIIFAPG